MPDTPHAAQLEKAWRTYVAIRRETDEWFRVDDEQYCNTLYEGFKAGYERHASEAR